jgi:hypothetical protein
MSKRPLVKGEGSVMTNSPITSAKKSKSHMSREAAKGNFALPLECCFIVLAKSPGLAERKLRVCLAGWEEKFTP